VFSLFLALRYLRPKRAFLSVITLLSVLGVTLGVMVLILVISVMTGFEKELQQKVIGFDAHIMVTNGGVLEDWETVAERIRSVDGVLGIAPFVQGPVLVQFENRRLAPKIRAIDPDRETQVTDLAKFIAAGTLDLEGDKTVIGIELAELLGANVGDKITLYSPNTVETLLRELEDASTEGRKVEESHVREMLLPRELEVTGIFESGRYLYDSEFLLVPLFIGQEIYGLVDGIHGLAIRTTDPFTAFAVQKKMNDVLEWPTQALTWMDINKQIFDAIAMERQVMFFILMFIVLVAGFGIMNTLITVTVQKTREIGILKALGATTTQVMGVFFAQGVVVGIFGTAVGLASGIWLVSFRNEVRDFLATLGIEVFSPKIYQFSEIPAQIVVSDVVWICVSAFVICSLAALLPAWFAARLEPVQALRHE